MSPKESGVLILQTIMTISRLQNLEAVYQTNSANNESMPQTRQMMAIELMQHKLVLRMALDDRRLLPTINTPCKQLMHRTIITCAARALKRKMQRAQTRPKGLRRRPDLRSVCLHNIPTRQI